MRPAPARKPGPRIDPVQLTAAVVGVLAGLYALLAGLTAWIAGTLFGRGAPHVRLLEIGPVLVRLPQHLGDPRVAWAAADSRLLPGPVGYYAALLLAVLLLEVLAAPLVWGALLASGLLEPGPTDGPDDRPHPFRSRSVAERPSDALATRKDLADLLVDAPQPGRVVLGHAFGKLVASQVEHSVLVVGATRSGKTRGFAIPAVIDWAGPAIVLSAKTDLLHATFEQRRKIGPVWVFDPTGVSGVPTSTWSPLGQAETWGGALRVADAMSKLSRATGGLGGSDHWQIVAAQLLAPLLHAAALAKLDMGDVLGWVKSQDCDPALRALYLAGAEAAVDSVRATLKTEPRQRDSAFSTCRTVLDAYEDPAVLEASRDCGIRPERLLGGGPSTVFLVATAAEQQRLAPLFLALVDELTRATLRRASEERASSGFAVRFDADRVLLLLDEAANIAPIPNLAALASVAGGEGLQLVTIYQDLSQVRHAYRDEWGSIASNHVVKVVLPGVSDPETLRYFSSVVGDEETLEVLETRDSSGRTSRSEHIARGPVVPLRALREQRINSGWLVSGARPAGQIRLRTQSPVA